MFSTFARVLDLGRGHALATHNERASNGGYVVRHGRPRLVCRWRPDPTTRKPVCRWENDRSEATSSAEPLGGCHADHVFALVAFRQTHGLSTRTAEP